MLADSWLLFALPADCRMIMMVFLSSIPLEAVAYGILCVIAIGLCYFVRTPDLPKNTEGEEIQGESQMDKEPPVKHGFWESWAISWKKGEIRDIHIFSFLILIGMGIYGVVMLLKTLIRFL